MSLPWQVPHTDLDALGANKIGSGLSPGDTPLISIGQFNGTDVLRVWSPALVKTQSNVSTNAEITVWTPAAGKKFRWLAYQLMADTTGLYTFKDNTGGTTILTIAMTANVALPYTTVLGAAGILSAAANNVLTCTGPGASHINGALFGAEV